MTNGNCSCASAYQAVAKPVSVSLGLTLLSANIQSATHSSFGSISLLSTEGFTAKFTLMPSYDLDHLTLTVIQALAMVP